MTDEHWAHRVHAANAKKAKQQREKEFKPTDEQAKKTAEFVASLRQGLK